MNRPRSPDEPPDPWHQHPPSRQCPRCVSPHCPVPLPAPQACVRMRWHRVTEGTCHGKVTPVCVWGPQASCDRPPGAAAGAPRLWVPSQTTTWKWLVPGTARATSPRSHLAAGIGATHGEPYPRDVPAHNLVVPREMVASGAHTAPCHLPSPVPISPGHLQAPSVLSVPHLGGHSCPNEVQGHRCQAAPEAGKNLFGQADGGIRGPGRTGLNS